MCADLLRILGWQYNYLPKIIHCVQYGFIRKNNFFFGGGGGVEHL